VIKKIRHDIVVIIVQ